MRKLFVMILLCSAALSHISAQDIMVVKAGTMAKRSTSVKELVAKKSDFKDPKLYNNFGDSRYAALYDYNLNTTTKSGDPIKETYVTALRIGDNGAVFTDYITFQADSITNSDLSDEEKAAFSENAGKVDFFFVPEIVQNIPEGKLTVTDQAAITIGNYSEPFGEIEWNLTEETDTFAGFQVNAAVGSYGGREWKVWFTEEIPVPFGPWKLAGLPGLVLKAQDSENIHEFKLISFTKSDVPMVQKKNPAETKTDRDKFIEMKNRTAQNPMKSIDPASISNVMVQKATSGEPNLIINGIPLRVPANIYIPLELK
ncbi:MAG: GLPGLI family protein [Paramuribaculum sp.]|nr:GLPGLI family protein [Paramuribaculum sp.]